LNDYQLQVHADAFTLWVREVIDIDCSVISKNPADFLVFRDDSGGRSLDFGIPEPSHQQPKGG
jgi:hypothetical protein